MISRAKTHVETAVEEVPDTQSSFSPSELDGGDPAEKFKDIYFEVLTKHGSSAKKKIIGRMLVDEFFSDEVSGCWSIALTEKERLACWWSRDQGYPAERFEVYEEFAELENNYFPTDLLVEVADALDIDYVQELDI